jgi:hypothetical protein
MNCLADTYEEDLYYRGLLEIIFLRRLFFLWGFFKHPPCWELDGSLCVEKLIPQMQQTILVASFAKDVINQVTITQASLHRNNLNLRSGICLVIDLLGLDEATFLLK